MSSPDLLHDFSQTSFGGVSCAQFWIDFILWENVLNSNPQCKGIMEIGTWEGGFSWFLGAQADVRDMNFWTCDVVEPERIPPGFEQLDVWANPGRIKEVADLMFGPVVLFCDGGNKPRELATFPQLMPEGSIFLVHDWGTETTAADVPEGLVEMYGNWCDTVGSITRVFRGS